MTAHIAWTGDRIIANSSDPRQQPRAEVDPAASSGALGITRAGLLDGTLQRMIAETAPELRLLTDEDRAASLAAVMAARPGQDGGEGVWLFCYGSLIWNPVIDFDDSRVACVNGWHRSFCLSVKAGRGTPETPGLLLGLDDGGSCTGVALHISEAILQEELRILWAREMVAGAYRPQWLALHDSGGAVFGHGIAFCIDRASPAYSGELSPGETVRRLATARGRLGSSAEYLLRTRDGLRALGIHDATVETLATGVEALQAAAG